MTGLSPQNMAEHDTFSNPVSPPHTSELTPRSKIAALMAEISSDSESDVGEKTVERFPQRKIMGERDANVQTQIALQESTKSPFDDEESEEDAIVPQGKVARRLQGIVSPSTVSASDKNAESDKENAYARVRKQLFNKLKTDVASDPAAEEQQSEIEREASPSDPAAFDASPGGSHNTPHKEASPGLFLTPSPEARRRKRASSNASPAGDSKNATPERDSKFLALVAKQAEKRRAKEAEEIARKAELQKQRRQNQDLASDVGSSEESDDLDKTVASRLTQSNDRPARKASKKALEEMNRETQRISRNMQLAHQAKTKKKITKESLLARFQFGAPMLSTPDPTGHQAHSTTASSAPASDHEPVTGQETPPTSPACPPEPKLLQEIGAASSAISLVPSIAVQQTEDMPAHVTEDIDGAAEHADDEEDFPELQHVMQQISTDTSKGKGKAVETRSPSPRQQMPKLAKYVFKQKPIKIHPGKGLLQTDNHDAESDDDLEVMPSKSVKRSRLDVFERVPKAENVDRRSLRTLRALAHIHSPPNKKVRAQKYVSTIEMQNSLHRRARQQALEERQAKIEELRAKGIIIQTAEEREKEQVEVEDLLEKARRGDVEIREKEKKAAKKAKANGETVDAADLSSEDDEDYEEGAADESDVDFSGSEEEGGEDEDEADVEAEDNLSTKTDGFIDGEASDDSRDEADIEADDEADIEDADEVEEEEDDDDDGLRANLHRRRITHAVLDDDDEEIPHLTEAVSTPVPTSNLAANIPAMFQKKGDSVSFGLTQAFAATMADTQAETQDFTDPQMIFESPPEPVLPPMPTLPAEDSLLMIANTQEGTIYPDLLNETETQDPTLPLPQDSLEGLQQDIIGTQYSELPDPTQDQGFASSPGPEQRFVSEPPSTVATIIVPEAPVQESPITKKRGRLQRRTLVQDASDSEEQVGVPISKGARHSRSPDAFAKMKKKREAALAREQFNKKKSEAKQMVEEQAQESEDEYAGLGGASDEDSNEEDEELVREMIDQADVDVDERQLAALHADKTRAADSKEIEKLYKDITNGGLRRKRHSEFDLSDSEDDAIRIRKRKQLEFAKMRKALLKNENVGKIAEDPKKLAFLKAIEDRGDDDDFDFLDGKDAQDTFYVEMDTQEGETQLAQQQENATQEGMSSEGRAKPLEPTKPSATNMRPPPNKRRTPAAATAKRPSTLAEIKQSVSYLVEEPGSFQLPSSDSESDNENTEDDDDAQSHVSDSQRSVTHTTSTTNPRRTNPSKTNIIDRLLLKRQSSSSLSSLASESTNNNSTLAFHNPSASSSTTSFVPSLLRRATTNSSLTGAGDGSAASTERAAGGEKAIKVGTGKKISVNFQKRQGEKERVVRKSEGRRREEREKLARNVRTLSGLGRATWEG